jgi:hypothetical protein
MVRQATIEHYRRRVLAIIEASIGEDSEFRVHVTPEIDAAHVSVQDPDTGERIGYSIRVRRET